jgi:hypothetical protein
VAVKLGLAIHSPEDSKTRLQDAKEDYRPQQAEGQEDQEQEGQHFPKCFTRRLS